MPGIENFKILLVLRDPRDILVSSYYSVAYSHPFPDDKERTKEFLTERYRVRDMTVDQYVIEQSDDILSA